jgi:CubicO group peptidase (beta-lactamase class C family)
MIRVVIVVAVVVLAGADRCTAQANANGPRVDVFPGDQWQWATPQSLGIRERPLRLARDYALTGGGAGMIVRHGKIAISWGDLQRKFDLKSTSKSIGVTALGLAIDDGHMKLDDLASKHHPSLGVPPESNRQSGWIERITLRHLATQSAGFEKPGGYTSLLYAPGTRWHYSDGGPNWLAECVTLAMDGDIESLMFDRILNPIGITRDALHWRKHQYRDARIGEHRRCEFGSGVHANVDAMARIGLLYLRKGRWRDRRLLSESFVESVSRPDVSLAGLKERSDDHGNASEHYGLLWWNNADGALAGVPRDAFWSWGLYDSLIVVIPSLDIVAARAGRSWNRGPDENHYDVLAPFLQPIVSSVDAVAPTDTDEASRAPYPASPISRAVVWDPPDSIRRRARGSDNWPITWMDDDSMLAAYGDGWGFEPKVPRKLSLGLARVTGGPDDFQGVNLRSETAEKIGQGREGIKASGLLMVDSVVYMWARNAGNSQLAISRDRGRSWTWSDWKFETSFGCPTFINYGRNYGGAPDGWVYVVSPDISSAYEPADRMVMARVPVDRIAERSSYQFFVSMDEEHRATWSADLGKRGVAFEHAGRCYRGGICYNEGLKRYLWCQTLPESTHPQGPRFQGGFGIYDAPHPWGPWTTLFFTEAWDVGPGESSVLPTKWISQDGRTIHLLFSGDDSFSVRRGILQDR